MIPQYFQYCDNLTTCVGQNIISILQLTFVANDIAFQKHVQRNILSIKMKPFPFIFIIITHPELSTRPD